MHRWQQCMLYGIFQAWPLVQRGDPHNLIICCLLSTDWPNPCSTIIGHHWSTFAISDYPQSPFVIHHFESKIYTDHIWPLSHCEPLWSSQHFTMVDPGPMELFIGRIPPSASADAWLCTTVGTCGDAGRMVQYKWKHRTWVDHVDHIGFMRVHNGWEWIISVIRPTKPYL